MVVKHFFKKNDKVRDRGGTRSGIERRQFDYTEYTPERRSGDDRRDEFDRRSDSGRRRACDSLDDQNSGDLKPIERRDLFRGAVK